VIASFLKKREEKVLLLGERRTKNLFSNLFCEDTILRVFISLFVSLGIGIYFVIANGFLYYDIFALVFLITIVPILTYALSGLWEEKGAKKQLLIALLSLSFLVAYFLSGKEIGGIDFSILISYALVLYISKTTSSLYACALGTVLGLCINPLFAPVFGICALISGLIWRASTFLSILCAFILSCGYGIFVGGYNAIAYLIPEILGASLIMYPVLRFELIPVPTLLSHHSEEKSTTREIELKIRNDMSRENISNMSRAFSEIAEVFYDVSKSTRAPSRENTEKLCLEVCESYCYLCPKGEICWKKDQETTENSLKALSEGLFFLGEAKKSALEEKFVHRCPNVDKIIDGVNTTSKNIFREGIKNDRLELSASSFELTSRLLNSVAFCDGDFERNLTLRNSIVRLVSRLGIRCDNVEVFGIRKKRILLLGVDVVRSNTTLEELKNELERELNIPLGEPSCIYNEDTANIEINELPLYKLSGEVASASLDKASNGDSATTFKNDFDKEYFLLADGMGSGASAHITSFMCVSFLEKILGVSKESEIALSMLNSFVRAKSVECSSSIDLLEVDVTTGESSFYKSGACASFIKRGDKVFSVSSKTAPIGIMKRLDCQRLSFTFNAGDICIMISDGVIGNKGDISWLQKAISELDTTDPKEIAGALLSLAKQKSTSCDDMTIYAIKFE
jgi:stage II sporulation protein E